MGTTLYSKLGKPTLEHLKICLHASEPRNWAVSCGADSQQSHAQLCCYYSYITDSSSTVKDERGIVYTHDQCIAENSIQ